MNSTTRVSFRRTPFALAAAGALALAACGEESAPTSPTTKSAPVAAQKSAPPAARSAPAPGPAAATGAATQKPDPNRALSARVKKALEADPQVNGQGIDVSASGGAITLWGTVADEGERRTASRIPGAVEGVKSVENRLVVVKGS